MLLEERKSTKASLIDWRCDVCGEHQTSMMQHIEAQEKLRGGTIHYCYHCSRMGLVRSGRIKEAAKLIEVVKNTNQINKSALAREFEVTSGVIKNVQRRVYGEVATQNHAKKIYRDFFYEQSPEMWWTIGWILTDGSISKNGRIAIALKDLNVLEKLKKAIGVPERISLHEQSKGMKSLCFSVDDGTKELLKNRSIFPSKSKDVFLPDVDPMYFGDFLRGVIEGDGSFFRDKRGSERAKVSICSASPKFLKALSSQMHKLLGVKLANLDKHCKKDVFYLRYGIKDTRKVTNAVYPKELSWDLCLQRKREKAYAGWSDLQAS